MTEHRNPCTTFGESTTNGAPVLYTRKLMVPSTRALILATADYPPPPPRPHEVEAAAAATVEEDFGQTPWCPSSHPPKDGSSRRAGVRSPEPAPIDSNTTLTRGGDSPSPIHTRVHTLPLISNPATSEGSQNHFMLACLLFVGRILIPTSTLCATIGRVLTNYVTYCSRFGSL